MGGGESRGGRRDESREIAREVSYRRSVSSAKSVLLRQTTIYRVCLSLALALALPLTDASQDDTEKDDRVLVRLSLHVAVGVAERVDKGACEGGHGGQLSGLWGVRCVSCYADDVLRVVACTVGKRERRSNGADTRCASLALPLRPALTAHLSIRPTSVGPRLAANLQSKRQRERERVCVCVCGA